MAVFAENEFALSTNDSSLFRRFGQVPRPTPRLGTEGPALLENVLFCREPLVTLVLVRTQDGLEVFGLGD